MVRISVAEGIKAQGSKVLTMRQLRELVVQLYKDALADLDGEDYAPGGGGGGGGASSSGSGGPQRKKDPNSAFKKLCAAEYAKLCVYLAARSVNILKLQIKHLDVVEDADSPFGVYFTVVFTVHKEGKSQRDAFCANAASLTHPSPTPRLFAHHAPQRWTALARFASSCTPRWVMQTCAPLGPSRASSCWAGRSSSPSCRRQMRT